MACHRSLDIRLDRAGLWHHEDVTASGSTYSTATGSNENTALWSQSARWDEGEPKERSANNERPATYAATEPDPAGKGAHGEEPPDRPVPTVRAESA